MKATWLTRIMSSVNGSPAKHLVDAKGKPKSKGHISKHKANHWGPDGHGDRSFTGIVAKGVNAVQEGADTVVNEGKKIVNEGKKVVNEIGEKIEKGKPKTPNKKRTYNASQNRANIKYNKLAQKAEDAAVGSLVTSLYPDENNPEKSYKKSGKLAKKNEKLVKRANKYNKRKNLGHDDIAMG